MGGGLVDDDMSRCERTRSYLPPAQYDAVHNNTESLVVSHAAGEAITG